MAKRFVDTEIWAKAWFQELSLKEKLLVRYIFEQCDCAGVWDINFRLASFVIGENVSLNDIDSINNKNNLFEVLDNDKIFVVDFIKFQYGTLSENCKPHKPIIEKLKKYNLFQRVSKGYSKGIQTLEEKEKEKEKEQVKEKEKEIPLENFDFVSKPIEPFCNSQIDECIEIYKTTCVDLCKLTGFERRDLKTRTRISEFLSAIGCDMDYYKRLCIEANRLKYIANSLIDISSMVNNHIGIMNGKYVKQAVENEQQSKFLREYEKLLEL
jgi:hypothetical protein